MKQTKIILGIFFLSSMFCVVSPASSANLANIVNVVQQLVQATPLAKKNVTPSPPTVVAPLATIILSEFGGTQNSLPFQELSTSRTAGTTALMPTKNAKIATIMVSFDYGTTISGTFQLANIPKLTPAILQAGLYVQVDIVPAANVANFYLTKLIPISDDYNASKSNSLFVSLIDANNNVYAAGAISFAWGGTGNAASYSVVLNNGSTSEVTSAAVPLTSATPSAIFVQQVAGALLPAPKIPLQPSVATATTQGAVFSVPQFTPVNALTGAALTETVSCSGGLQSLSIYLTDAQPINAKNKGYYTFYFLDVQSPVDPNLTNLFAQPIMQQLFKQGMYIAINMLQNPVGQPAGNYAQVCLTDIAGNVFAQQTSPALSSASGSGETGFVWALLGFNMISPFNSPLGTNQTYINWIPIANGWRVLYKDSSNINAQPTSQPYPAEASQQTIQPA